jgi:hypothetical protein
MQYSPGSKNTIGEFFDAGLNCSDILDKLEDAKDGFYWITLKRSKPIKVGYFTYLLLFRIFLFSRFYPCILFLFQLFFKNASLKFLEKLNIILGYVLILVILFIFNLELQAYQDFS